MTHPKEYDHVVPLYLIPVTIAQRIREQGEKLYRISIVRTHLHHYTVKCKCRAKIAMGPLEDEPLSGESGAEGMAINQMNGPNSPGPELIAGSPGNGPAPESISVQQCTVVDND